MKKLLSLTALAISVVLMPVSALAGNGVKSKVIAPALKSKVNQWMQNSHGLRFLENKGQMTDMEHKPVKDLLFKASGGGVDMYVTTGGLSYIFTHKVVLKTKKLDLMGEVQDSITGDYCRADMELVGADIRKENIIKEDESKDYNNYYIGSAEGILNVHSYQRITIKNIYPGIDWVLYTAKGAEKQNKCASPPAGLQYDFVVHPGADASLIKLRYKWTDKPEMQNDGSMKINLPVGYIKEGMPVTHSMDGTDKIHTDYILKNGVVGFALANYDKSKTLVIDPPLTWGTYFGGSGTDNATSIWSDGTHVFMTGGTTSINFPVLNPGGSYFYQGTLTTATENMFIGEFTNAGVQVWTTYYGGTTSGESDQGSSISGDANNIWIAGQSTGSATFPTTNPNNYTWYETYDTITNNTGLTGTPAGGKTAIGVANPMPILLEFNKSTGTIEYSTYFPGGGNVFRSVSDDGNYVFVTGYESAGNFPVLYSAGYYNNAFVDNACPVVVEFNATSGNLLWSTNYGSGANGSAVGQCIYSDGTNVWLTGVAFEGGLPITNPGGGAFFMGTIYSVYNNDANAFIAKFTPQGVNEWVTYYGGNGANYTQTSGSFARSEFGEGIYSDGSNVWLTGWTGSTNLPVMNPGGGAYFQSTNGGLADAFIAEFTVAGIQVWGTYYGGEGMDEAQGINKDFGGNIWLTGYTQSPNLPVTSSTGYYQSILAGTQNAFVAQFNKSGAEEWSTYLGGNGTDAGTSIFSTNTNLWVTGSTTSTNLATENPAVVVNLSGAYNQSTIPTGGTQNAFIADFTLSTSPTPTVTINTPTEILCNGAVNGSASVNVMGGVYPYSFSWSPAGGTGATGTGLGAGVYTVKVTAGNGNSASASVTISQPTALNVSASSTNGTCSGGISNAALSNVSGGTPPYTYLWSNGVTTSNLSDAPQTVTWNFSYEPAIQHFTVPAGITTVTIAIEGAQGGTGWLAEFDSPNGHPGGDGASFSGICTVTPGDILGIVVGGEGQAAYYYAIWGAGGGGASWVYDSTELGARGGSPSLSPLLAAAAGGGGSGYDVSTGAAAGFNLTTNVTFGGSQPGGIGGNGGYADNSTGGGGGGWLSNGTSVTGADGGNDWANGFAVANSISIYTSSGGYGGGGEGGSGGGGGGGGYNGGGGGGNDAENEGGGGGGSYLNGTVVGTPAATQTGNGSVAISYPLAAISAGTYTLTVTDANGCTGMTTVTISQPAYAIRDSIVSGATINELCNGARTGSATVGVRYGVAPYTYLWTPTNQTTSTAIGIIAGNYSVTITDFNGCSGTASVIIMQPAAISATTSVKGGESCNTNSASIIVSDGSSPYTYLWSGGGTNSTQTGLSPGNYTITITDNNGCSTSAGVTVPQFSPSSNLLCWATVDTLSLHNIISWDTTGTGNESIDSILLYFFNASNVWQKIGEESYHSPNQYFVDNTSNPNAVTVRYSVVTIDTCGDSSGYSNWQNTMFISNIGSGTFSWSGTGYLIEGVAQPVATYYLFRNDTLIDSISGTQNKITDVNYSSTATYWVGAKLSISICPLSPIILGHKPGLNTNTSNLSRSNILNKPTGIENIGNSSSVDIYPNPSTGQFTIAGIDKGMLIEVYDDIGRKITTISAGDKTMQLNLSNESNGIYLIRIIRNDGTPVEMKKIIKEL